MWWSHDLGEGMAGYGVRVVQRKLGMIPTGVFTDVLGIALRGWQWAHGLPATGVIDAPTATLFGNPADWHLPPEWWQGPDADYSDLLAAAGLDVNAVRRLQGAHGLKPTGDVDELTARIIDIQL